MKLTIETKTKSISIEEMEKLEEEQKEFKKKEQKEENLKVFSGLKKGNLTEGKKKPKSDNKFHLPVLSINQEQMWESKPLEVRTHWTDEVAYNTCVGNCCGHEGLKAGCCYLDPDDIEHVLGPVDEEWIKKFVKWMRSKGHSYSRQDVVIDYEEGKLIGDKFFGGHEVFHSKESYPILRIQAIGPRFACKFLNWQTGKCGIYEQRSDMCRDYLCNFVKSNFLVRTKQHPNTWQKLR